MSFFGSYRKSLREKDTLGFLQDYLSAPVLDEQESNSLA